MPELTVGAITHAYYVGVHAAPAELVATAPAAAVGGCTPDPAWGTLQPAFAAEVVDLLNQHRRAMGLNALTVAPVLTKIAEYKSMNMSGYMYMQHDDPAPVARSISDRFTACGYPTNAAWGENIAYGLQTPADVMRAWLSDIGHRQNVENSSWSTIGVGVVRATNGLLFWTQDFGTTGAAPAPPPPPDPPPPAPGHVTPAVTVPPQRWLRKSNGVIGVVTGVTASSVTWKGKGAPVTRTPKQFGNQFTYVQPAA